VKTVVDKEMKILSLESIGTKYRQPNIVPGAEQTKQKAPLALFAFAPRLRVGFEDLVSMRSSIPMRRDHPQGVLFL
jgi:hypothetical protein